MRVFSRLFRGLFLEKLGRRSRPESWVFSACSPGSPTLPVFVRRLAALRRIEWVVYAKRPFAGPAAVLAYLGRYTHRVAIANSRLVALAGDQVSFRWRDYRHHNKNKVRSSPLTNLYAASCYTHCQTGSIASVITAFSPTAVVAKISHSAARCSGSMLPRPRTTTKSASVLPIPNPISVRPAAGIWNRSTGCRDRDRQARRPATTAHDLVNRSAMITTLIACAAATPTAANPHGGATVNTVLPGSPWSAAPVKSSGPPVLAVVDRSARPYSSRD